MALKLGEQALKSCLKITYEFQIKKLVSQRIMVKATWNSDSPWVRHF